MGTRALKNLVTLLVGTVVALPAAAAAQTLPGRFEIYAGPSFAGGSAVGSRTATQTENVAGGGSFTFFQTDSRFDGFTGIDVRIGVRVLRWLAIEGGFGYATPTLRTTVARDTENAQGGSAIGERLTQYVFDGAGVVLLRQAAFARGRGVPFLLGGIGHVRQLDDASAVAETGRVYHAGAGLKYRFVSRARGFVKGLGIRGDGRWVVRDGGIDLGDEGRRGYGAVTVGGFLTF